MRPIEHIRRYVFKLNQSDFAVVAGVRQSSVSRWENGVPLSLPEMQAIRDEARERGIRWEDRWFFESPASPQSAGEAAA